MPSEDLVERVARAICEQRMRERGIPLRMIDAALVTDCAPMARAALAAMPQPVGYAKIHQATSGWPVVPIRRSLAEVSEMDSPFHPTDTVAALVPVEVSR